MVDLYNEGYDAGYEDAMRDFKSTTIINKVTDFGIAACLVFIGAIAGVSTSLFVGYLVS